MPFALALLLVAAAPPPPGAMVDLGGHRLHVRCTGAGSPTVVVENGLGDFSFDWALVTDRVSKFARICTYDRAGYAWSEPGPKPRSFAQLNLELKDALEKLHETPPYVLVGHSFGGPVVRSFAARYPSLVSGMVLVDSVFEDQRVPIQGKAVRIRDGATGRAAPAPRETMTDADRPEPPREAAPAPEPRKLNPLYERLPADDQRLQLWAQALSGIDDAENSQREWSTESLAAMHASPQEGVLGEMPLVVLTREKGGYSDKLDVPAAELEKERLAGQAGLARLSRNGRQIIVPAGHNMEIEAPDAVAGAIRDIVLAVRRARSAR
ncbi:MAG: alpha/beta hydrolase [Acidobacteriota bacterium]|nr:alpha/beta hydrolase [Acidobacteriota bacterium]